MMNFSSILFVFIIFFFSLSIQQLYHAALEKQEQACHSLSCSSCTFSKPSATVEKDIPTSGNLSRMKVDEVSYFKTVNPTHPKRKIIFKENEAFGIGNVYRSLASVYLLSLVTHRQFLGRIWIYRLIRSWFSLLFSVLQTECFRCLSRRFWK